MSNYKATLDWLFSQLPLYQRQGKSAYKKDLTNIKALAHHLNNPQHQFKSIHVAGTNGKGSVCHILASIFQENGYKTGLHTSPHLKDFRERIKINGRMIPRSYVVDFVQTHKEFLEKQKLSFFEMSVGMAFDYFAHQRVDIAIIETGLGGRLDSTNILEPELSIITNIGFDHTKILGDTLSKIACEKAGIIKANTPVVIGRKQKETTPIFTQKAALTRSPLYFASAHTYPDYTSDLKGEYQRENKNTALTAVKIMQDKAWSLTSESILKGVQQAQKNTGLQGRWQQLAESPKIISDTAHNAEGLSIVLNQLQQLPHQNLHFVLGVVNDKDLRKILPLFPKNAFYYFCKPNVPRGLSAKELQQTAALHHLKGKSFKTVNAALSAAKKAAQKTDVIFVGGSTFTVAEIL